MNEWMDGWMDGQLNIPGEGQSILPWEVEGSCTREAIFELGLEVEVLWVDEKGIIRH